MIKSGNIKPVFLLAFIGIVLIALVEPVAGHTMGQGNMMGQEDVIAACPDNETHTMHCMMHCTMGNQSANETIMHCMMGDQSVNGTMMRYMIDQNASTVQVRLDCARFWLEEAINLHEVHMKDPITATNESQMELMDQMMRAYECIKGENVTENMTIAMMNTTAGNMSASSEQVFACSPQARLDCARIWLEKAIKLHELHMKDPITATNESQMVMMDQMTRAYECIKGENVIIEMDQNASSAQVRLDCARFWLEQAMELHELHLKDPTTTTNESQIELMNRITRAYECVTGKNVTSEINNTTAGQAPTGDEHGHQA